MQMENSSQPEITCNVHENPCEEKEYFDEYLFSRWCNHSTFADLSQLAIYICEYTKYIAVRHEIRYLDGWLSLITSAFGLASSTLTIATLWSNKYFTATSYLYFRAIAALETFHMVYIFMIGLQAIRWHEYTRTYSWYWFTQTIGANMGNCCASAVDFLVVFLSIERAVACLAPKWFRSINRRSVAVLVCAGSILFSASLLIPNCFAVKIVTDPATGIHYSVPSAFGRHWAYVTFAYAIDIFWFFMAACVTVTAALVVFGMVKSWKLKQSLHNVQPPIQRVNTVNGNQDITGPTSSTNPVLNTGSTSSRQTIQLCYLQITQALPTAINYVLYTAYVLLYSSLNTGYLAITSGMELDEARQALQASYNARYVNMFVNLSNELAHCFHFYLYLAFSRRFRQGVQLRFQRKGNRGSAPNQGSANRCTTMVS